MGYGAESPQIEIPPVILGIELELLHPLDEGVQIRFSFAASDDFSQAGDQDVHAADRLSIIVEPHIESLDFFRIVGDDDRALAHHLCQELLVLALQIVAPSHREFKPGIVLLQLFHRFGVCHVGKGSLHDLTQGLLHARFHELAEEGHILRAFLQYCLEEIFQKGLGKFHVAVEFTEGHFRFNHPKFCKMAFGVGILGSERGPEGVDVLQGHGIGLALKLPAHREKGFTTEEILGVVDRPILRPRNVVQVQGGHQKLFAGAFCIAGADDRGVYISEPAFLEKLMDGIAERVSHPCHRSEHVRPCPEVGDFPQVLDGVAFLLQRIRIHRAFSDQGDVTTGHLDSLVSAGTFHYRASADNRTAGGDTCQDALICELVFVDDYLQTLQARTVIHLKEAYILAVTLGSHPTFGCDYLCRWCSLEQC